MRTLQTILILTIVLTANTFAQVAISESGGEAASSAILDVSSTTKGMLIPRMTAAQKEAISSPAEGLTVYQTDAPEGVKFFDGNVWVDTEGPDGTGAPNSNTNSTTGVSINSTGAAADASAILDVSSTTQGLLPPRMTQAQRTAIASPVEGLMVYQTDNTKGLYVYDGSAWHILYYNHYVGESYGGGVVIYVDDSGLHGIIAATADVSESSYSWNSGHALETGVDSEAIYSGHANTARLVKLSVATEATFSAALAAWNFSHGGYDDWHLPSNAEFELIYTNRDLLGSFVTELYWCSTEYESGVAYGCDITSGEIDIEYAYYDGGYVRAVRYF